MRTVPLKIMADWTRNIGLSLRGGLSAKEAFKLAANRGTGLARDLSAQTLAHLNDGEDLAGAFKKLPYRLPPLFLAMAEVGTKTGRFPEILRELENYFRFQLSLRRQFLQRITWPVVQLVAAIFVIAGLIFLMGTLAARPDGKPGFDILGFGLAGPTGALVWLMLTFGGLGVLGVAYWAVRNIFLMTEAVDGFLLRVPALGTCLHTLAMARLCLGMHMTMDSSLPLKKSVPLSLDATDNGAFRAVSKPIVAAIHDRGTSLADAFERHRGLFPEEFLHVLETSETSGSVPEEMGRLAKTYNELAEHKLALLNQALGWAVWATVAALIIFLIFRMALAYIGILNDAVNKPLG